MIDDDDGPVGQLCPHVSGNEDGPICGWSFNVGDGRIIHCGEISKAAFADLSREQREAYGGKPFGWFLMCYWHDRHEIWAKVGDEDLARRMVLMIGSMLYAGALWRAGDVEASRKAVDDATVAP